MENGGAEAVPVIPLKKLMNKPHFYCDSNLPTWKEEILTT